MRMLLQAVLAAAMAVALGCAAGQPAPAAKTEAAPVPKAEPVQPPAPPAPPAPPVPPPAPEAAKKGARGPLGLPTLAALKDEVGLQGASLDACKAVYASYKDKVKAAQEKVKNGEDKKAARKESKALREEILGKLKESCSEEQKKKLDELAAPAPKKKA